MLTQFDEHSPITWFVSCIPLSPGEEQRRFLGMHPLDASALYLSVHGKERPTHPVTSVLLTSEHNYRLDEGVVNKVNAILNRHGYTHADLLAYCNIPRALYDYFRHNAVTFASSSPPPPIRSLWGDLKASYSMILDMRSWNASFLRYFTFAHFMIFQLFFFRLFYVYLPLEIKAMISNSFSLRLSRNQLIKINIDSELYSTVSMISVPGICDFNTRYAALTSPDEWLPYFERARDQYYFRGASSDPIFPFYVPRNDTTQAHLFEKSTMIMTGPFCPLMICMAVAGFFFALNNFNKKSLLLNALTYFYLFYTISTVYFLMEMTYSISSSDSMLIRLANSTFLWDPILNFENIFPLMIESCVEKFRSLKNRNDGYGDSFTKLRYQYFSTNNSYTIYNSSFPPYSPSNQHQYTTNMLFVLEYGLLFSAIIYTTLPFAYTLLAEMISLLKASVQYFARFKKSTTPEEAFLHFIEQRYPNTSTVQEPAQEAAPVRPQF